MKRTTFGITIAGALALAACSPEPAGNAAGEEPEVDAADTPAAETPAAVPAQEEAVPAPEETVAAAIPATAHGRWGLVPGDCTSTKGDAKGLLIVEADKLRFYESVGRLGEVSESGPNRIRATFSFSGEGMTWTRDEVLEVQDGGKTLIRREYGDDAAPSPFKYAKCA